MSASPFLALLFGKLFRVGPELTDRHTKIITHCCHYIAGNIGQAPLDSPQIKRTVAKRLSQGNLGELFCSAHLRHRAAEYLIGRFRFSLEIRSDRLGHYAIVED